MSIGTAAKKRGPGRRRRLGPLLAAGLLLICAPLLWTSAAKAETVTREQQPLAEPARDAADETERPLEVPYEVQFKGLEDNSNLADLASQVSQLVALKDRPPATLGALRLRAQEDVEKIETALKSESFYDPKIELSIEEERRPVQVTLTIEPGPVYRLQGFTIDYVKTPVEEDEALPQTAEELGLLTGAPARAPDIVAAERDLLRKLKEQAHPLPAVLDREALVDHAEKAMTVTLQVDAGPLAVFGPTRFEGLTSVELDYLEEIIPWKEGEPYDIRKLEEARLALSGTALFDSLTFESPDQVDDQGRLPVTVRVLEAAHRSIGGGLSFSTDLGPGANAFWEHRNLLDRNEKLRLSTRVALYEQRAEADFTKPRFLRPDQSLLSSFTLLSSQTEAYDEDSAKAFVGLERTLDAFWKASGGFSAEFSKIKDEAGQRDFLIYGTPGNLTRDSSNDLLNPTEGSKLSLTMTPYFGTLERNALWLNNEVSGAAYYALDEAENFVLAARGRVGSIIGEATETLPATKRFYAGGGGSVRGYEFRKLGPLDEEGDPLGGRSVIEVGAELRWRVFDDFGVVPFIDGGTVGDQPWPDFEEDFLWAAGLGLRYYTPVGPLRLDVAFPVNGRPGDDLFQFYISLGQAF